MSVLGSALLSEFRALIHDTGSTAIWADAKCYALLTVALHEVAARLPLGETWSNSAFTVSANSDTATLPVASSEQYAAILELRRHSDGYILSKRTREEMDRIYWHGLTTSDAGPADPIEYAMYEGTGQTITVRFQAPALAATAIDMLSSILPVDLSAGTETVPLGRWAVHATAHLAGAYALEKMHDFEVKELRLNRGAAAGMRKSADAAIRSEAIRRDRLDAVGRQMRWVS